MFHFHDILIILSVTSNNLPIIRALEVLSKVFGNRVVVTAVVHRDSIGKRVLVHLSQNSRQKMNFVSATFVF